MQSQVQDYYFFISILIHSQEQDVLTFLNETSDTFKDFALLVRRKLEIFIFFNDFDNHPCCFAGCFMWTLAVG